MQFSVAGEAWSGRLKVVGVLGNLLTSQQIRTQRLDQNQGGFYNHLPPPPTLYLPTRQITEGSTAF